MSTTRLTLMGTPGGVVTIAGTSEPPPEEPTRYVILQRDEIGMITHPTQGDVFQLTIRVTDAGLMPPKIFVIERRLIDPYTGNYERQFVCVADPYEVTLYPEDEPYSATYPGYFRDDVIDLCYPSESEAALVWEEIQGDVRQLLNAYNRLDEMHITDTQDIV